jgi:hypothetical protein
MNNLFEQALLKNQLSEFILGNGEYFELDRDTDQHSPLFSYKNHIENYISNGNLPNEFWKQLIVCFSEVSDLNIFLDNTIAYLIPYYNCANESVKKSRVNATSIEIINEIKLIIEFNKESLLKDKRGSGVEWNSQSGILGGIISNLTIIKKRGGPDFLPNEFHKIES